MSWRVDQMSFRDGDYTASVERTGITRWAWKAARSSGDMAWVSQGTAIDMDTAQAAADAAIGQMRKIS